MTPQDGITTLTDAQLEAMLDRAAKRGAIEALRAIGLQDDDASVDIHELRTLLTAWRDTRRAVWQTMVKAAVMVFLGIIGLGVAAWLRQNTGGQ
ncbi:DUF6127 family protein [Roseicyclus amphidinii]|uniref:DUF6127 family protein n=1 Tax=Roseicyclus amphidinii TaxID=3034232 RepID=UPI0024E15658|nr:DUF6127 family protein [Roseicyclus sp. Amp-Y-6]